MQVSKKSVSDARSGRVISKIRKRDGRLVKYDKQRIVDAIFRALHVSNKKSEEENLATATRLADKVEQKLVEVYSSLSRHPQVEEIQDLVEAALIEEKLFKALKNYVNYRQLRRFIREEKKALLNKEQLEPIEKEMSLTALQILESRYLIKDKQGQVIESVPELFARSAVVAVLENIVYDDRVLDKEQVYRKGNKVILDYQSPRATAIDLDFQIYDQEVKDFLKTIKPKLQQIPDRIEDLYSGYTIGRYQLLYGHLSRVAYLYDEVKHLFPKAVRISFNELLDLLSSGYYDKLEPTINKYYEVLMNREFIPNSPTLMNAGHRLGQLSACFVLDIEDDLKHILLTATHVGIVFQSGGGVGINYGKLRPKGDVVASTNGVASGPLSFMRIIDTVTDVIKQGGKRRGANMGVLDVFHPDIEEFIRVKEDLNKFTNFNLSVGFWKTFFDALRQKKQYELINPRTKKVVNKIDPDFLLEQIAQSAWKSAEPGCLFFDNVNKHNVLKPVLGNVRSTNPCGEQPLYPYESCNLGSIDIAKCVIVRKDGKVDFDWNKYRRLIRLATRFLDGIIDINSYPLPLIRYSTRRVRKIGLGVMGVADVLFKMGIPYNSKEAYKLMSRWAEELSYYSMLESVNLAKEKGAFSLFEESEYIDGRLPIAGIYDEFVDGVIRPTKEWDKLIELIQKYGIRNSMTTTLAPTGSISMIADTSGGLEPQFALVYKKNLAVGSFFVVDPVFEEYVKSVKRDDSKLKDIVAENYGRIGGLDEYFSKDEQRRFVTAQEIHWLDHLVAQYVWQRWVSASISKTINMPNNVTAHDIKHAYLIGHELGLKGLTIFRDGSRTGVIEYKGKRRETVTIPSEYILEILKRVLYGYDTIYSVRGDYARELTELIDKAQRGYGNAGDASTQDRGANSGKEEVEADKERCPVCGSDRIVHESGCEKCIDCGWSACTVG